MNTDGAQGIPDDSAIAPACARAQDVLAPFEEQCRIRCASLLSRWPLTDYTLEGMGLKLGFNARPCQSTQAGCCLLCTGIDGWLCCYSWRALCSCEWGETENLLTPQDYVFLDFAK